MNSVLRLVLFVLAIVWMPFAATAQAVLNVGYFREWPLPVLAGKAGGFGEDAGFTVKWRAYDNSRAMLSGLAAGDIDIALSLGVVPVLVARLAGQDVEIVDIAVDYSGSLGCVADAALGLTKENAAVLEGARVALPVGTLVHAGLLRQLSALGVDATGLELTDMSPRQAATALAQGKVDVACAWGSLYAGMKSAGAALNDLADAGGYAFDAVVVRKGYGNENADVLALFLKAQSGMNIRYQADPAGVLPVLAVESGLTEAAARKTLDGFAFPPMEARLGAEWLGGGVSRRLKELAVFLVAQSTLEKMPDGLDALVNPAYLQAARALVAAEIEAARAAEQAAAEAEAAAAAAAVTPEAPAVAE